MRRAQVFSAAYKGRYWGRKPVAAFYSGDGSADQFAEAYRHLGNDYVLSTGVSSIVDLGCGDFRIGRGLANIVPRYCGVDIVSELIQFNVEH